MHLDTAVSEALVLQEGGDHIESPGGILVEVDIVTIISSQPWEKQETKVAHGRNKC